jgi:hypothetical protein
LVFAVEDLGQDLQEKLAECGRRLPTQAAAFAEAASILQAVVDRWVVEQLKREQGDTYG